jgi:osmotically inducible protein OsmC
VVSFVRPASDPSRSCNHSGQLRQSCQHARPDCIYQPSQWTTYNWHFARSAPIIQKAKIFYIPKRSEAKKVKILYTAEVTVTGGREGQARSTDGNFVVDLRLPQEMGGQGEPGTNPEQLFAAGYAACFQSALITAARRLHQDASASTVRARVGIGPSGEGRFGLAVELHVQIPGLEKSAGIELVELAHKVCPYSNATRGNIPVRLFLDEEELTPAVS